MQKAIDLYRPDMEEDPLFQSSKRALIDHTMSQTAITIPTNEQTGALLERLESGDIADEECMLWMNFCSEEDGDDWWLHDVQLRVSLLCTDLRARNHPELSPVSLFIDQPEVTEHFHRDLNYREKLMIIRVLFGNIAFKIAQVLTPPKEPRLQRVLDETYHDLVRELTDDSMPPRTRFDVL